MRRLIVFLLALALLPIFRMPASAQMSNMPEDLRARLAEINPTWGKDILGNVATTLALYTPILAAAHRRTAFKSSAIWPTDRTRFIG